MREGGGEKGGFLEMKAAVWREEPVSTTLGIATAYAPFAGICEAARAYLNEIASSVPAIRAGLGWHKSARDSLERGA